MKPKRGIFNMRYIFAVLIVLGSTALFAKDVQVDFSGKVLMESRSFVRLDMDAKNDPATNSDHTTANQLGAQFNMALGMKKLSLLGRFDVNTDPFTNTKTYFSSGEAGGQKTDSNAYGSTITVDGIDHPNQFFGNASTGPWSFSVGRNGDSNLMIRTLFLKWDTSFASYTLGRQPRHWGLGMFLDDGSSAHFARFPNVTDSLFMTKKLSILDGSTLNAGYTHLDNGAALDTGNDDVRAYEGSVEKEYDHMKSGFKYVHQRRSDTNFYANYYDVYLKSNHGKYGFGIEALFNSGRAGIRTVDINRYGLSVENSYDFSERLHSFLNFGAASGSDGKDRALVRTFTFNRKYNPLHTYLLFEQGLGRLAAGVIGGAARAGADLDVNTIFNAYFIGGGLSAKDIWPQVLDAQLSIGTAVSAEKFGSTAERWYGAEPDLKLTWKLDEGLTLTNYAAILYPGELYTGSATDNFERDLPFALGAQLVNVF